MTEKTLKIEVEWCDDGKVFVAASNDIVGLILEAETINELIADMQEVVPILLEENGQIDHAHQEKDVSFAVKSQLSALLTPANIKN